MSFSNKGIFGAVLAIFIAFFAISLFIKILPIIAVMGLAIWGITKITKFFENKNVNKFEKTSKRNIETEVMKDENDFEYEKRSAVDVDYTEIKK